LFSPFDYSELEGTMPAWLLLTLCKVMLHNRAERWPFAEDPPAKRAKGDDRAAYKPEHMDIYESVELEWPPALHTAAAKGLSLDGMTPRMQEVAWFVFFAFPVNQSGHWEVLCSRVC
jgi:hypothetical protein